MVHRILFILLLLSVSVSLSRLWLLTGLLNSLHCNACPASIFPSCLCLSLSFVPFLFQSNLPPFFLCCSHSLTNFNSLSSTLLVSLFLFPHSHSPSMPFLLPPLPSCSHSSLHSNSSTSPHPSYLFASFLISHPLSLTLSALLNHTSLSPFIVVAFYSFYSSSTCFFSPPLLKTWLSSTR